MKITKAELIKQIIQECKQAAFFQERKEFNEGDTFLKLCFMKKEELFKIAKSCKLV